MWQRLGMPFVNLRVYQPIRLFRRLQRSVQGSSECVRLRLKKQIRPAADHLTSQRKVPADGNINWIGVADAISRGSRKKDAMTEAYAQALSEEIANLTRRLPR